MNDRIQLILKTKNISASKFADEIGVQRSSISHILSGRNNPSLDFIQKILKRFPDINSSWIISGTGSMYIEPDLFTGLEEHKTDKYKISEEIFDSQDDILSQDIIINEENHDIQEEPTIHPLQNIGTQKPKDTLKKDIPITPKETEKKNQSIVMKSVGKKIERIIIFYSDKSCIEYIPE